MAIGRQHGSHIWAESFDKPLSDLFAVQDEIVASLGSQLGTQLAIAEGRRAERTSNPDSIDLYFQGLAALNKGLTPENVAKAHDLYERALAVDPENAEARIGLAVTDIHNGANFFVADRKAAFAAAEAGLTKVLSSAPDNALAHMWLGFVDMLTNRAPQAIAECDHALDLDRNLAAAHSCLGLAKIYVGHQEETEAHIKEALRLSPRDTYASAWMNFASLAQLELGSYEDAVGWSQRALEANRNYPQAIFILASALAQLGRLDEAHSAVKEGLALNPSFAVSRDRAALAASDNRMIQTRSERYIAGLRKAGLPEE